MITRTIVNIREYANATEKDQHKKENNHWSKVIVRYMSYMLACFFLLFALSPVYEADAASLSVKIDGVSSNYLGKQVYATFDGKKVSMKNTPGIVINGTSYVSYKNVFCDSKIGASSSYDSKTKTITIKKYDKTLVMTLGSTSATLNGAQVTMPAAPVKVTYVAKKTTKILVPTEFVTSSLGYGYSWSTDTSTVTAAITTGTMLKYDGANHIYSSTKPDIIIDDETIDLSSTLSAIILDNSVVVQAKKIFASDAIGGKYKYDKKTKTVKLTLDDHVIEMKLESRTAKVDGKKQEMPTAARMIKNLTTKKSYVCVPAEFVSKALLIDYRWDSSLKASVITTGYDDEEEDTSSENDVVEKPVQDTNKNDGTNGTTGTDSNQGTNNGTTTTPNTNGSTVTPDTNNGTTTTPNTNGGTTTPVPDTQKVIANYQIMNQYYEAFTKLKNNNTTNFTSTTSAAMGYITGITKITDSNLDREVYNIQAQQPFTNVTSSQTENMITVSAANMMGESATYPFYNDLVTSVQGNYNGTTMAMDFAFTLTDKNLNYDLSLSADFCTLTITIYTNYVESVVVSSDSANEYITVKTLKPIDPKFLESESTITLMVTNMMNSIGDIIYTNAELTKILGMNCVTMNNNDFMMTITRASNAAYTFNQGPDNAYTFTFKKDGTTGTGTSNGVTNNNGTVNNGTTNNGTGNDSSNNTNNSGIVNGSTSTGATSTSLTYTAVQFPISSGLTLDSITNEDLYHSKQIKIYLPGDQTSTVNAASILTNSSYVKSVDASYVNGMTAVTIYTTRICGFDYKIQDGYLNVAIDVPNKVYDKIVVLDPGHGGSSSTGTIAPTTKTKEKDVTLEILYTKASKMFEGTGIKTYYIRTADTDYDLYERPKFSAQVTADLYISLHMNAVKNNTTAQGTEVWYNTNEKVTMNGLTGKMMATTFSSNLASVMNTTNRGAKGSANLIVLKNNTVPSVLIELGFMSTPTELAKLESADYQKKAAQSIVATICEFFDEYPTGR